MAWDAFASTDGRHDRRRTGDEGFTLVEVLVSILLISVMAVGVAQMFALAIRTNQAARHQTSTTILAAQKMEQLRSLTWGYDDDGLGLPVSDTTTDLSADPFTGMGDGLNPSPASALDSNTPDYLDARGNWVGNGGAVPPAAVYIRRWSVEPLPTNPNNTLVLQVLVTTVIRDLQVAGLSGPRRRHADDALIATVKTRKAK
jgi:prepilin-type N-terminal cleavage/methylation domain-containing protein